MKIRYRMLILIILDIIILNLSILFAYLIRFEGDVDVRYFQHYFSIAIPVTMIKIVIFYYFGLYRSLWRYASIDELISVVISTAIANMAVISLIFLTQHSIHETYNISIPRSIFIIDWMLDVIFIGGMRFSYRVLRHWNTKEIWKKTHKKNVLIIGAGSAGSLLIREIQSHKELQYNPVGIIDDDTQKHRRKIHGVPVVGTRQGIKEAVLQKEVDLIVIAIPTLARKDRRELIELCDETGADIKILPAMYDLIEGKVSVSQLRSVQIEDLLGRDPIELNLEEICGYIEDSTVMVTGGGGSIGSELCRQIAGFSPKRLIIVDIYENNAYDIQNELYRKYPQLQITTLIASIRDRKRMEDIFAQYIPEVVFHAAAHKHVPLMEESPMEAIKNNVFGSWNVIQLADQYGVKRFVQISTDKAVNPTNVMGATKRICEMMIQAYAKKSRTEFVAVRFGNVLGSNGSVIPLFKKQIAAGGPVTVTHPDIIRYFMTIPEAVQLVIQAGGMAKGGEIFVLDMGEPVKIDKLARDLIHLSGYEPEVDIPIEYTGLRPGEKLFEELLMAEEGLSTTKHKKIHVAQPMDITIDTIQMKLHKLENALSQDRQVIVKTLREVVPTYVPEEQETTSDLPNEEVETLQQNSVEEQTELVHQGKVAKLA